MTYNHREKSLKASFTIYLDLEYLLKKSNLVKIILNILTQGEKPSMNLQAGQCLQNVYLIKNRFRYYRGIDCIKKLCKNLKDHALEIINCEKKEISLT